MKRIILAVVILLVSSLVFVVNFPFKVSRSIDAIEVILGDPNYSKEKEIIMNGTYHVNLFSPDKFSGEIMVTGYERDYQGFEMVDCDVSSKGSSLIWEQKSGKNIVRRGSEGYLVQTISVEDREAMVNGTYESVDKEEEYVSSTDFDSLDEDEDHVEIDSDSELLGDRQKRLT